MKKSLYTYTKSIFGLFLLLSLAAWSSSKEEIVQQEVLTDTNQELFVDEVIFNGPLIVTAKTDSNIPEIAVFLGYYNHLVNGDIEAAAELNVPKDAAMTKLGQYIERFGIEALKQTYSEARDGNMEIQRLFRDGDMSLLLVKNSDNFILSNFFKCKQNKCKLIAQPFDYDLSTLEKVKSQLKI